MADLVRVEAARGHDPDPLVAGLVDASTTLLPEDLQPLFARSIEPSPPGM